MELASERRVRAALARYADQLGPLVTLIVLVGVLAMLSPRFLTAENLLNVGRQVAALGVVAVGETIIIIAAGIDLSVGSVAALAGVVTAVSMKAGLPVSAAILAGIGVGGLAGALNGLITTLARMPSFVVTLGMMMVCRGAALQVAGRVTVSGLPDRFGALDRPLPLGIAGHSIAIPPVLIVFALVAVLMTVLLRQTRTGRWAYAIGGNAEAARLAGVPVGGATVLYFALGGLLTGLAGVMLATRLNVASPTAAELYELRAIAATVIGGASLMGGRGGVGGTVVGVLIMALLLNGLDLLNKPPDWQLIAVGATIIVAVFLDHLRRRGR